MTRLDNLYRQVIMDHYKNPRNKGLKGFASAHLYNPSCGDDVTVEAHIENDVIQEINHDGVGCSICCSSASVMSEVLRATKVSEAKDIIKDFYKLIKGEVVENKDRLDEAMIYEGVAKFPARMRCAAIAWEALERILQGENNE